MAGTKNNIGEVYRQLGRYDEAMKSYSEALEINEKCLGSSQAGAAYNYNNMALVQEMLGNFDESLKLHSTYQGPVLWHRARERGGNLF